MEVFAEFFINCPQIPSILEEILLFPSFEKTIDSTPYENLEEQFRLFVDYLSIPKKKYLNLNSLIFAYDKQPFSL
jgi:hypothetical protein